MSLDTPPENFETCNLRGRYLEADGRNYILPVNFLGAPLLASDRFDPFHYSNGL